MKTIKIVKIGDNNFFLNNLSSILILRNEFRIYGNLVTFCKLNIFKQLFLILSTEEILLGIEFGFIDLNVLNYRHGIDPFFLPLECIFKNVKNLAKILNKKKKIQIVERLNLK